MAKRGDAAREKVMTTIKDAFISTGDFVTILDKKIYVTARDGDNGERLQFAISITMPKTPITSELQNPAAGEVQSAPVQTELAPDDKAKVAELMAKLGLA